MRNYLIIFLFAIAIVQPSKSQTNGVDSSGQQDNAAPPVRAGTGQNPTRDENSEGKNVGGENDDKVAQLATEAKGPPGDKPSDEAQFAEPETAPEQSHSSEQSGAIDGSGKTTSPDSTNTKGAEASTSDAENKAEKDTEPSTTESVPESEPEHQTPTDKSKADETAVKIIKAVGEPKVITLSKDGTSGGIPIPDEIMDAVNNIGRELLSLSGAQVPNILRSNINFPPANPMEKIGASKIHSTLKSSEVGKVKTTPTTFLPSVNPEAIKQRITLISKKKLPQDALSSFHKSVLTAHNGAQGLEEMFDRHTSDLARITNALFGKGSFVEGTGRNLAEGAKHWQNALVAKEFGDWKKVIKEQERRRNNTIKLLLAALDDFQNNDNATSQGMKEVEKYHKKIQALCFATLVVVSVLLFLLLASLSMFASGPGARKENGARVHPQQP